MKLILQLMITFIAVAPASSLAEKMTFRCSYLLFSDQYGSHNENEALSFSILLDSDTKKAYLVGNNGSSEIIYRANADRLTFIEETTSGNILVTIIARDGQSVHSRHPYVGDKFLATQYYGRCSQK